MVMLVVGLPGAGKSFFARQFASMFGAPMISIDKIRDALFANHTYSRDENAMIMQIVELMVDELFTAGKTFVIDGGFDARVNRDEMIKIAAGRGFRTLIVWVQTDEATSRRRAAKRVESNPADEFKQPLSDEQFDRLIKQFTSPIVTNNTVVISGKHTYATQARAVLKKIVAINGREDLNQPAKPSPRTTKSGRAYIS